MMLMKQPCFSGDLVDDKDDFHSKSTDDVNI